MNKDELLNILLQALYKKSNKELIRELDDNGVEYYIENNKCIKRKF